LLQKYTLVQETIAAGTFLEVEAFAREFQDLTLEGFRIVEFIATFESGSSENYFC
jgi:hypothetical protein